MGGDGANHTKSEPSSVERGEMRRAAGRRAKGLSEDPAAEAWQTLYRLVLEGEAHSRMQQVCREIGLPINLVKVVFALERTPVAMRDLASYFSVDASYCTSLVDGLEDQGLAERRTHPVDRRIKTVELTDQGREVLARIRELMGEVPSGFCALSLPEQRQLRDLLAKVANADPLLTVRKPS